MDKKIRVAIIGVGNCASSLVQGVHFYKYADKNSFIPGLMHTVLGGYHVGDIEFSAAIDVNISKVGKDLSQAIRSEPNNTIQFYDFSRKLDVTVEMGMVLDGLGKYLKDTIQISKDIPVNVTQLLKDTNTDVVVNFLPVGSEVATRFYAQSILEAKCAMVNAIPVFLATDPDWSGRFAEAGLPILGDDVKSQVGATIVHRALTNLFVDRGVRLDRTYQLNFGGNTDFMNMLERERLESKKISKTGAVTSLLPYELDPDNIHVGPSDYVPWLNDRKFCYIQMEGTTFGNVPLKCEVKLEVWDSPNSAGVVIDAIRCAKIALNNKMGGPIYEPSSYFFKHPPVQHPDSECKANLENWISKLA